MPELQEAPHHHHQHHQEQQLQYHHAPGAAPSSEPGPGAAAGPEQPIVHEERILEAIDQLRKRKARPDADRICNYMLRKFQVAARNTIEDLQRLIDAEKVIQVDYKGNTSYRNASKWTRLQLYKNRPEGFVKDRIKLTSAVINAAISVLMVDEPDYLDHGVPPTRLVDQLLDGTTSSPTTRRIVEEYLKKQVTSGHLKKLSSGNYSLVDIPVDNGFAKLSGPARMETIGRIRLSGGSYKEQISSSFDYEDGEGISTVRSTSNSPNSVDYPYGKKYSSKDIVCEDDNCYRIIFGKNPMEEVNKQDKNGYKNGSDAQNGLSQESQNNDSQSTVTRRPAKAERKQRLCVRSDDSSDLIFKFEGYKEEKRSRREETQERYSEEMDLDDEAGRSSANPSPTPSNNNTGAFRSARRKRAKKVFDPSDNNVVKRKRGRQPNALKAKLLATASQEVEENVKVSIKETLKDPNRHCSLCSKDKHSETLIACRDCTVRAHPSCIYSPDEISHKSVNGWQCERCKTCTVCYETAEEGPLYSCFTCDDAYHQSCHTPRIPSSKTKIWNCSNCNQNQKSSKNISHKLESWSSNINEMQANVNHTLPPVLSPQVSPSRTEQVEDDTGVDAIDPNIPDASDWTSEQVYQYFARLFPKEAEIFRNQDIDGHSLLLLKRSDVLGGLDLLLGPALKIYRHVLKLQVRRDDPRLYWL